jgi:hypothetical protein
MEAYYDVYRDVFKIIPMEAYAIFSKKHPSRACRMLQLLSERAQRVSVPMLPTLSFIELLKNTSLENQMYYLNLATDKQAIAFFQYVNQQNHSELAGKLLNAREQQINRLLPLLEKKVYRLNELYKITQQELLPNHLRNRKKYAEKQLKKIEKELNTIPKKNEYQLSLVLKFTNWLKQRIELGKISPELKTEIEKLISETEKQMNSNTQLENKINEYLNQIKKLESSIKRDDQVEMIDEITGEELTNPYYLPGASGVFNYSTWEKLQNENGDIMHPLTRTVFSITELVSGYPKT